MEFPLENLRLTRKSVLIARGFDAGENNKKQTVVVVFYECFMGAISSFPDNLSGLPAQSALFACHLSNPARNKLPREAHKFGIQQPYRVFIANIILNTGIGRILRHIKK